MSPLALLLVALAIAAIVLGFTGRQDNLIAAIKGTPYKGSTLK